jgi:hypothetical protein
MLQQVVNAATPIIVSAIVAILTAIIGLVGDAAIKFINAKKAAIIQQIGVDKYNADLAMARTVWGIVDEYFRTNPQLTKSIETTGLKFADEIRKKIPGLTDDEVTHLQEAVAGEVNKGKAAVTAQ